MPRGAPPGFGSTLPGQRGRRPPTGALNRPMRPFECLLLLADLAALVTLAAPRLRQTRLARALPVLAVLAAVVQGVVEHPDWRLFPAYGLSAILALAAFTLRPWPRWVGWSATALAGLALALSTALVLAFPVFRVPPPDGPYAIGTSVHHWTDADRAEAFTADPADHRELMVQVWYPARPDPGARRAPYIEDGAALAPLARLLGLPGFIFGHLASATTNAIPDAPAAAGVDRFPVVIFSHGRAGYRQHNTALVEHLVSHGYVVVTIDHPYAAAGVRFPDGRIVPLDPRMVHRSFVARRIPDLARDVSFTLDQLAGLEARGPLAGRLDMPRVGVMGVSLGGGTTAQACHTDPRLHACMIVDVWIPDDVLRDGLAQPTLLLTRDAATMRAEGWREADVIETDSEMRGLFDRLSGDGYLVRAPGLFHTDFADTTLLSPLTRRLGLTGPVEPRQARAITNSFALAFFDRYLKGVPAPLLDDAPVRFPRVRVERRKASTPP